MLARPTLADPFLDVLSTEDHVKLKIISKDLSYAKGKLDIGVIGGTISKGPRCERINIYDPGRVHVMQCLCCRFNHGEINGKSLGGIS